MALILQLTYCGILIAPTMANKIQLNQEEFSFPET